MPAPDLKNKMRNFNNRCSIKIHDHVRYCDRSSASGIKPVDEGETDSSISIKKNDWPFYLYGPCGTYFQRTYRNRCDGRHPASAYWSLDGELPLRRCDDAQR